LKHHEEEAAARPCFLVVAEGQLAWEELTGLDFVDGAVLHHRREAARNVRDVCGGCARVSTVNVGATIAGCHNPDVA